jgi:CheY-like chemotaxis protein
MARIMVVEDEPITAADLEQKLGALGHEVTWVDTGEEAIAEARAIEHDVILMDIRLRSDMSGIDAAQQPSPIRRRSNALARRSHTGTCSSRSLNAAWPRPCKSR